MRLDVSRGRLARRAGWPAALLLLMSGVIPAPATAGAGVPTAAFTLDGVAVTVSGTAVGRIGPFDAAPAGSALQSASATGVDPYTVVMVTAIPFGTANPEEPGLGVASPGSAASARAQLQDFRNGERAARLTSPTTTIFGDQVAGAANLVDLTLDSATPSPAVVVEWVADAGSRLWMLQATEQVPSGSSAPGVGTVEAGLSDLSLAATPASLAATTTLGTSTTDGSAAPLSNGSPAQFSSPATVTQSNVPLVGAAPVPFPSWWSGQCDTNDYSAASLELTGQSLASYPLSAGAEWEGLVACGPRPYYGEGPDVEVSFPGSEWGVLEWECVGLSMRWMDEAWGVHPYPANGSGVVWNYATTQAEYNPDGPDLEAIPNDGSGALPEPGDVLSFGPTTEDGHTAVVTAVDVDSGGDGSVTILEENASPTGWDSVPVTDWVLNGYDGGVSGWLHDPDYLPVTAMPGRYVMGGFSGSGRADLAEFVGGTSLVMPSTGTGWTAATVWSAHDGYGTEATLVGDVTGDGRADLVAVDATGTWVYLSTGSGFEAPQEWSSVPFFGTQATLLADLTGNGREDLVAVNAGDVEVMLSTGSGFSAPEVWSTTSFSGTETTLAGDVTGDGRDSLIAVDGDATWVMESTGSGFAPPQEWSDQPFAGTEATLTGNLTGDGETDLIAVDADSVSVMLSTGSAFAAPAVWAGIPFAGSEATLVGDVTGQGEAALVDIDANVAWVMQSTGSGFDRPRPWLLPS